MKSSKTILKSFTSNVIDKINRHKNYKIQLLEVLKNIYDPEIPINILDLGLIYKIEYLLYNTVKIRMTLTSMKCPVSNIIINNIKKKVKKYVKKISKVYIELIWDPKWNQNMISKEGKILLNLV